MASYKVNFAFSPLQVMITLLVTKTCNTYPKKAIPLQAWTGPEGSRRLKLLDFKTVGT